MSLRIGFLITHPIQYYTPIFRELAALCDLTVFFAHRQTAEQQARAGFGVAFDWDIDLVSGYRSKFLENVSRRSSTDRFFGCDTPGIAREIVEGRFDAFIVPGWGFRSFMQAVQACRGAGVPVLVRGDSQLAGPRNRVLRIAKAIAFPWVLRRFDGFLYVGQRNREYLLHYGARADRLFFAPHCVDNALFRAASDEARRSKVRAPGAKKRVLFVGKLLEQKRPFDLLKAVALLREKRSLEVVFAGAGELESELREFARGSNVPAIFHGFVNQSAMPAVYADADVIVLPSDLPETWGLAVNEAMACGLPAVVSDAVGCGPDLIEQGVTGAVFPVGQPTQLASAIESALSLEPTRLREQLAARMQVYSPFGAAKGIMQASAVLAAEARPKGGIRQRHA